MGSRTIATGALLYLLLRLVEFFEPLGHDPKLGTGQKPELGSNDSWGPLLSSPRSNKSANRIIPIPGASNGALELLPCIPSSNGQKVMHGPCKVTAVITMCEKTTHLTSVVPKNLQKLKFSFSRQYNQTLTLVKSILLAMKHGRMRGVSPDAQTTIRNNVHLELIIISNNEESVKSLQSIVGSWNKKYTNKLHLIYQAATYLKGYEWMENLYAPCSTLRLLLPQLLPHVDTLIYTDTDILVFQHILDLWNELVTFTPETQVGMVRSRRQYNVRPLVQRLGLKKIPAHNSGVMLMNLTRLREDADWKGWLLQGCQTYEEFLQWADQDIMDVYFHIFPKRLQTLPCVWNFVPPFFVNQTLCNPTEIGASILHGISSHFFKPGKIGTIYRAYEAIELEANSQFSMSRFVANLKQKLQTASTCTIYEEIINCDNNYFYEAITKKLDNYF